jgi:hypothetical protein
MLQTNSNRMDYVGNGSTAAYPFTFLVNLAADLVVTIADTSTPPIETTLQLGVDYVVTGLQSPSGGDVNLLAIGQSWMTGADLKAGYSLTIRRVVSETQTTDIRNQGAFYPETYEDALDYLTMQIQQLQEQLSRAVTTAVTLPPGVFDPAIPPGIQTAGMFLISTGSGWEVIDIIPAPATEAQEIPAGVINGINTVFTLENVPVSNASVKLFMNRGIRFQGVGLDYTVSGNTLTTTAPPPLGAKLYANYWH